jgi:ER degradation enhancer, mannosidase alpha-like 2
MKRRLALTFFVAFVCAGAPALLGVAAEHQNPGSPGSQQGASPAASAAPATPATPGTPATQNLPPTPQDDGARTPEALAEQVKQEFLHAWNGYKQYAWGHDELKPLSKTAHDWYSGSLEMTPVDALDTLILMGMKDEADKTREFIATSLNFNQDIYVKNFEITIRLLGGLLSSYELTNDPRLLALAQDLGDRLMPAFDSPTGMPYVFVNLKTAAVRGEVSNPAEIGTLIVEFGTLAKLTGKQTYFDKAKRAMVALYSRRSLGGLVGSAINVKTGAWTDMDTHIGGGIDSYYEYLLKCSLLFGDKGCGLMWRTSLDALNSRLADDTPAGLWYGHVDIATGERAAPHYGALEAFFAGTLALAGEMDRARRLEESNFRMWTKWGVEPEEIDYSTMKIVADGYSLRPEAIESAFYLFSFTRDPRYREMGRTFLDSLVKYCRTDDAYAALSSVQTKEKADEMQSYFLAETLKYLYLLFAPPQTLDVNKVIFNTEAHPMRHEAQAETLGGFR